MKNVTTYVGIDVYKKDLFVGMLMGHQKARVTRSLISGSNDSDAHQRMIPRFDSRTNSAK